MCIRDSLYGAGDAKIGSVINGDAVSGKRLKNKFLKNLPALGRLVEDVKAVAKRGYLLGLDGRRIHVRHSHAALNTLLQGAGAIVCKTWITHVDRLMRERGYVHGWDGDYAFNAFSHDEIQVAIKGDQTISDYRQVVIEAMEITTVQYKFRCPLACESKVGKTWNDTH